MFLRDAQNGRRNAIVRIGIMLLLVLSCVLHGSAARIELMSDALPDAAIFLKQPSILHMINGTGWYDRVQNATSRVIPRYYENLQEWPVLTKSSTACIIGGLGDLLAQCLEIHVLASSNHYDLYRALSVSLEGLLISGPLMHYSYEFLESIIPVESANTSNLEKWLIAIFQVLIDCLIMDCIFVATLMITTAILEGRIRQVTAELKLEYWNGVKISWASSVCFAPLQCFLFRYVPILYRVLAMNLQDTVWNACVSYVAHRSRKKDPTNEKRD